MAGNRQQRRALEREIAKAQVGSGVVSLEQVAAAREVASANANAFEAAYELCQEFLACCKAMNAPREVVMSASHQLLAMMIALPSIKTEPPSDGRCLERNGFDVRCMHPDGHSGDHDFEQPLPMDAGP